MFSEFGCSPNSQKYLWRVHKWQVPQTLFPNHVRNRYYTLSKNGKPEDHWSCIAHLSAEDMLKSVVIEEKK